jgi:hypothetical protein
VPVQYHIFHQNLRVFGGRSLDRNEAFADAMEDISDDLGSSDRVLVAGFTEVMNAGAGDALAEMATALDQGLQVPYLFACGVTAVGAKPEYVAISVFKGSTVQFEVEYAGKVLRRADKKWQCFASTDCDISKLPTKADLEADVRGLAYVVGTIKGGAYHGKQMVMGFMHNMYNLGERSIYYSSLTEIAAQIYSKHSLANTVKCFFGGDFNLEPHNIRSRKGPTLYSVFEQTGTKPTKTTVKNAYDFWLTNMQNVSNTLAKVWTITRSVQGGLSDHAAISLQLPMAQI